MFRKMKNTWIAFQRKLDAGNSLENKLSGRSGFVRVCRMAGKRFSDIGYLLVLWDISTTLPVDIPTTWEGFPVSVTFVEPLQKSSGDGGSGGGAAACC